MKITCTSIIYFLKHSKYIQGFPYSVESKLNTFELIQKTTTALKVHVL